MNKILHLFDETYVLNMFKKQLLPLYPQFSDIKDIKIIPYKKMVWATTYHVVIGFNINFIKPSGQTELILIVCSAHSNESRENVFQAMQYLWKHKFNRGHIDIPKPLFYLDYFQGTFYQGLIGENLMYYIDSKNYQELEIMIPLAAELFARLHQIPAGTEANFNPINSRIKTVVPGVEIILREMSYRFDGKFKNSFDKIYSKLISKEENFFKQHNSELCLIHGDAHTENIIHTGKGRVGLIDFTDFCLGDFARDIGTFIQQLEYKIIVRNNNPDYAKKMSDLFLTSYLSVANKKHSSYLTDRIRLYYDWTVVRTAVYLFLKHNSDPYHAEILLEKVKNDLQV